MANVFWTAAANGSWTDPGNWSTGAPPGPDDDAVLGITGFTISDNYTVSITTTISVNSLTISNAGAELFVATPGMASIAAAVTNDGDIELQNAVAVTVGGDFSNAATTRVDTNAGASGSTLAIVGTLTNSSQFDLGNSSLTAASIVTAASLANTGTVVLEGNSAGGTAGEGELVIAAAAPATESGSLSLSGQSLLQFSGGSIGSIAQGGDIYLGAAFAYLADAGATTSNSALSGLTSNAGTLELEYGATVALAGGLTNTGTIILDNATNYGLSPSGGSTLTLAGTLTNSGRISVGNGGLTGTALVSVGALANTGTISLNGNGTAGNPGQAVLDVATTAPSSWTGTLDLYGAALLEYSSGSITDVASGAQIYIATSDGYIADAGATTTSSALTGLATVEGDFELQYGAALALAGSLTVTGSVELDTQTDYGDNPSGGSSLTVAGTLATSGTVSLGGAFFGDDLLTSDSIVSVAALNNTGAIYLTGNAALGNTKQAILKVGSAAPATWTGSITLSGQSLLQYTTGSINTIASGAKIEIASADGYIADAGAITTDSALTGLTTNAGDFELQYGPMVSLAAGLANTGSIELDTANNYADTATGGSLLTIAGALNNTGYVTIGSSFLGGAQLSSGSTLMAAALTNTGTISLTGGPAAGTSEQALLDIAAAAPADWTGTLSIAGQGVLEYGSGSITSVASGAQIYFGSSTGYIEDAGAQDSNSALSGLTKIAGDFELQYGPAVSVTGDLTITGSVELDTQTNYGDTPSGGSSLTIAGALINSGYLSVGGSFFGNNSLTADATVSAATLNNSGGTITLTGNNNTGSTNQAQLIVAGAAPGTWTGTLNMTGASLVAFGSGQITGIAQGAEIDINSFNGYIADSGALTSNSALAGLASNAGVFELQDGATAALTGGLTNSGTLTINGGGTATTFSAAGLTNQSGGNFTATGNGTADAILTLSGVLTNMGTVTLNSGAMASVGSINDASTLSVAGGADFSVNGASTESGTLDLGGDLDLAGGLEVTGTGTLAMQGGMAFTPDGAALTVDAGGTVSGNGTVSLAVANSGTITASGGALDITGAVSGGGTLAITGSSTLELGGATAEAVAFGGAGETLHLDQPGAFTGAITGLVAGDTIDLGGEIATSAVINGTTLTVTTAAGSTMSFQVAGTGLATTAVLLTNDFHGGTNLELVPSGPVITGPTTQLAFLGFPSLLGPLSISDQEAGASGLLTVTLTAGTGTLSGVVANAGTLTGSGTNSLSLTGDLADINLMLAAVTYGGGANGSDTVQVTVADATNATATQAIAITTETVPYTDLLLNTPIIENVISGVFTALSNISVSDPYAETTGEQLSITTVGGGNSALQASGIGGTVTGQDTNVLTVSGTVATLNNYYADPNEAQGLGNYAVGFISKQLTARQAGLIIKALNQFTVTVDSSGLITSVGVKAAQLTAQQALVALGIGGIIGSLFLNTIGSLIAAAVARAVINAGGDTFPNIVTPDGLVIPFDTAGEYVLAQATAAGDSFQIQARLEPVAGSASVSRITQVAVEVGADRVTFAVGRAVTVWIDGNPSAVGPTHPTVLSAGEISQIGPETYNIALNTGEIVTVVDNGTYLGVTDDTTKASSPIVGLIENDFVLPNGTALQQPLTTTELDQYIASWQVSAGASILDYSAGQSTATFANTSFPDAAITLGDLPAGIVALAAQVVQAAGIPAAAVAAAEFDYIASGGDPSVLLDDASFFGALTTASAASVTESGSPATVLGIIAPVSSVVQPASGPTVLTFDVYLTGALSTDTVVNYAVISPNANDFNAAAFRGTLPSGSITIAAGQTTGTIAVDVPQGALGTLPSEDVAIQITSPSGVPVFAPNSVEAVGATQPTAPIITLMGGGTGGGSTTQSSTALPELEYLGALGTFTQSGNNYTLNLGDVTLGESLSALQFAVTNGAGALGDSLMGSFTWPTVAGFTVSVDGNTTSGASLAAAIAPLSSDDGLTVTTVQDKFGPQDEVITFNPVDTNASGYSAPLSPVTLTITDTLQTPPDITSEAYGDVHILTYNGLEYDFQAAGQFILAESTVAGDSFDIQLRLQPYSTSSSVTYITQVALSLGTDDITFSTAALDGATAVLVDGTAATLSMTNPVLTLAGGTITEVSPTLYKVAWNTGESATITEQFSIYTQIDFFQVNDSLPYEAGGTVMGLQGENEGAANDFQLPDGTVLQQPLSSATLLGEYANAWRVTPSNALFTYLPGQSFQSFANPPFPTQQITLADLPASVVAAAAALVAAAGITDPTLAATAELDYIATGDPSIITADADAQQQDAGTVAAVVTPSTAPAASLGVEATQTSVVEAASGVTPITFTVYLTAAETAATVVDYTLGTMAGDLSAAAFGSTLPSGAITIAAGQTTGQITIDVPQGALGALPNAAVEVQIASPGGAVPIFDPTAQTQIVNNTPEPGAAPVPVLTYLGTGGTFSFNAATDTYTLNLGSIAQGSAEFEAEFGVTNTSTGVADLLGGSFTSPLGGGFTITGNELPTPLGDGQVYQGLYASVDTATLGSNSITLTFNPLDENASGYSAPLAPITLDIVDSVTPPAAIALNTPSTVIFPDVHVGTTDSQQVSVTNTAAAGAAALDVTLTASGEATASGAVTQLAPGATNATGLAVGINTAIAGALAGSVTETALSDSGGVTASVAPENPYIDVFGDVYRLAAAEETPNNLTVALGAPGSQSLVVTNTDPNDGYSENLIATVIGTTGAVTATGSTGDIDPQQSSTIAVKFSTATAGQVGTVTLGLKSDGTGIDGLGLTNLGNVTVPIVVQGTNPAVASLSSSNGTLTQTIPNYDTLNLGTVTVGSTPAAVSFAAYNAATGPADVLGGSYTVAGNTAFTNTGLSTFSGVTAGAGSSNNTVSVNTSTAGTYTETIVLTPTDSASSGTVTLNPVTLTVNATVQASATAAPTVSSPDVTVAENAAATAIGITTTEDPSFTTPLTATITALPSDGTVTLADGVTAVAAGEALSAAQLTGLLFTPTTGVFGQSSTLSYTVTDPSLYTASGMATLVVGPAAGNPVTTSGTLTVAPGQAATALGIVSPTDPNYTASQLSVTVTVLPNDGTVDLADGVTPITLNQALSVAQLTSLTFVPGSGAANASSAVGYTVTDPANNSASGSFTLAVGPASGGPVTTSGTLTVAPGQAATALGIVSPTDPDYTASQLSVVVTALPNDGTVDLADGVTPITLNQVLSVAQLTSLTFLPGSGVANASSPLGYSVTDPAKNATSGHFTLSVGAAAVTGLPAAPVLTPPNEIVDTPTPTIAGTAVAGSTVSLFADGLAAGSATASATGAFAATVSTALSLGAHTLTATATTSAGTSAVSSGLAIFDVEAPGSDGIIHSDDNSLQIGTLQAAGYALDFTPTTESLTTVDGTLSLQPDTEEAYLQRLYQGLLGRSADTAGLSFWDNQLYSGYSQGAVANLVMADAEYQSGHASMTNTQFVTSLYQGFLGQTPTASALASYTGLLASGTSRGDIVASIANSQAAKTFLTSATPAVWVPSPDGTLAYEAYQTGLGREVDLPSLVNIEANLRGGLTVPQFFQQIVASTEFTNLHGAQSNTDFVTGLYQAGLGRAPDAAGLSFYTGLLNSGTGTRADVLFDISTSAEAAAHLTRTLTGA